MYDISRITVMMVVCVACVACATTASAAVGDLDMDPALAGWWEFDEEKGSVAADSSKHKRKGVLKGGMSFDKGSVPGKSGKALKFDGGEQYVEITGYKGITGKNPRTVTAWVKTEEPEGYVLHWGEDDFGKTFSFGWIEDDVVGAAGNGGRMQMVPYCHDDKWHHIAVVLEEADAPNFNRDFTVYLDGAPQETSYVLHMFDFDTGSGKDVRIGIRFEGSLDDVRIYDRPLTDAEIEKLYALPTNTK